MSINSAWLDPISWWIISISIGRSAACIGTVFLLNVLAGPLAGQAPVRDFRPTGFCWEGDLDYDQNAPSVEATFHLVLSEIEESMSIGEPSAVQPASSTHGFVNIHLKFLSGRYDATFSNDHSDYWSGTVRFRGPLTTDNVLCRQEFIPSCTVGYIHLYKPEFARSVLLAHGSSPEVASEAGRARLLFRGQPKLGGYHFPGPLAPQLENLGVLTTRERDTGEVYSEDKVGFDLTNWPSFAVDPPDPLFAFFDFGDFRRLPNDFSVMAGRLDDIYNYDVQWHLRRMPCSEIGLGSAGETELDPCGDWEDQTGLMDAESEEMAQILEELSVRVRTLHRNVRTQEVYRDSYQRVIAGCALGQLLELGLSSAFGSVLSGMLPATAQTVESVIGMLDSAASAYRELRRALNVRIEDIRAAMDECLIVSAMGRDGTRARAYLDAIEEHPQIWARLNELKRRLTESHIRYLAAARESYDYCRECPSNQGRGANVCQEPAPWQPPQSFFDELENIQRGR